MEENKEEKKVQKAEFADFGLDDTIMDGLDAMRFIHPTPVQELTIPIIMEGSDLIACAQTGTGKTAAYLLPTIHENAKHGRAKVSTLIIAPTRELAQQIDQQMEGFGYFMTVRSYAVYGGGSGAEFAQERNAFTQGTDIIIATPGRLLSHLKMGYVDFSHVTHLILDEADRMLDMGFHDDIMHIVSHLPKKRQTLMFSATMPENIRKLARTILKEPKEVNISLSKPAEGVTQVAFNVFENQKIPMIKHLLRDGDLPSVIIFAGRKTKVRDIEKSLRSSGMDVRGIQSDLDQNEREEIIRQFKNKRFRILVGTDIISRGIDVDNISMVINYDVPGDAEDYIHRVGRTARAATTGEAVTFISETDQFAFKKIEDLIGSEIRKPALPEHIGEGPAYEPGKRRSSAGRGRSGGGGGGGRPSGGGGGGRGKTGGGGGGRPSGGGNRGKGGGRPPRPKND